MNPQAWPRDDVPPDFKALVWRGRDDVNDAAAIVNVETGCSLFRMRLTHIERQVLIDGGDVFIAMYGQVIPFAATAHLDSALELGRTKLQ